MTSKGGAGFHVVPDVTQANVTRVAHQSCTHGLKHQ